MKIWVVVSCCIALISHSNLSANNPVDQSPASSTDQLNHDGLKIDTQFSGGYSREQAKARAGQANTVSPYEILQYIEDHKDDEYISLVRYWQRLGIGIERWGKYGRCEVGIFELELDREPGSELLLRLYENSGWSLGSTRYLIFKPQTPDPLTESKLLGYIDLDDQRYEVPEHRVISSGDYHWLVLTALTGRGTGYRLQHHRWYQIDEQGTREVLHYPSGKYLSWTPVLETHARILSAAQESGTAKVVIEFTATYGLYDKALPDGKSTLWSQKQKATFIRDEEAEEFKYNERESELSEEEMETVHNAEGPTDSDILKYNYSKLEAIAFGKNEKLKEWLRSYLVDCRETTEKRRLLTALGR